MLSFAGCGSDSSTSSSTNSNTGYTQMYCPSSGNARNTCNLTSGTITSIASITRWAGNCNSGDYGYDASDVWVQNGCSAIFNLNGSNIIFSSAYNTPAGFNNLSYASPSPSASTVAGTLDCGSSNYNKKTCTFVDASNKPIGQIVSITGVKEESNAGCGGSGTYPNNYWGFDSSSNPSTPNDIWVTSGCRALFSFNYIPF